MAYGFCPIHDAEFRRLSGDPVSLILISGESSREAASVNIERREIVSTVLLTKAEAAYYIRLIPAPGAVGAPGTGASVSLFPQFRDVIRKRERREVFTVSRRTSGGLTIGSG